MPVQSYVSAFVCVCVCVVCLLLFIAKLIAYLCSLAFNVPAQSELYNACFGIKKTEIIQ